jgi:hypothetical protein
MALKYNINKDVHNYRYCNTDKMWDNLHINHVIFNVVRLFLLFFLKLVCFVSGTFESPLLFLFLYLFLANI